MSNVSITERLEGVGCGTWTLDRAQGLLHLDAVACTNLGLESPVKWEDFLQRVDPQDRMDLRERTSDIVKRLWVPFLFERPNGVSVRVEAIGSVNGRSSSGIMVVIGDPQEVAGPVSDWFARFAQGLGLTRTSQDVSAKTQELSEELFGAQFAGLSVIDTNTKTLSYLGAKPMDVDAHAPWGSSALSAEDPVSLVARRGKALYYSDRKGIIKDYPHLEKVIHEVGLKSWAGFPMRVSGKTEGVLVLHWGEEREFSSHEIRTLDAIADQVGQALSRSVLYEQREGVLKILQQVVLPKELPHLQNIEMVARYLPSEEKVSVGGDWYDSFKTPDGQLVLSLGDVEGHGLESAAVMGQLRNAVRGAVAMGMKPDKVMEMLNVITLGEEDTYATVICAFLDIDGNLTWSSAGHFPPIVEEKGRAQQLNGEVGPLLGLSPQSVYPLNSHKINAGTTLTLYTDGLVERRDESIESGIGRLEAALELSPATALDARCHQVLWTALGERERGDDLCLLMVRKTSEEERSASADFSQSLKAPAAARAFLQNALEEWEAEEFSEEANLLISEAVTNAVIHARSDARVTIKLIEKTLTVSVEDRSREEPERKHPSVKAVGGRGVALIDMLSNDWGVETRDTGKLLWFTLIK